MSHTQLHVNPASICGKSKIASAHSHKSPNMLVPNCCKHLLLCMKAAPLGVHAVLPHADFWYRTNKALLLLLLLFIILVGVTIITVVVIKAVRHGVG